MRQRLPLVLLLLTACGAKAGSGGPTIYVALDQEFSQPVLDRFAAELQIDLVQRHDSEAAKTVGLVSMLMEERSNPRCSVFWNNELANTVRLAQAGLLAPYDSPSAADVPAAYRDPQHRWTGFAARARVLVVNTELLPDRSTWPGSYADLVDPKWQGRCGVARPTTGTTLTHFTALRQVLGEDAYGRLLDGLVANEVHLLASNGATVNAVREGKLAWAFTDTDDYHVAQLKGFPVACVFPDQQEGGIGTMLIPNSVAIIKDGPDQANARRLVDRILARETEALLAAADSAQIPLRTGITGPADPGIRAVGTFRQMVWDVDWTAANLARCAAEWDRRFGK
ncbi:MAG: extracellular solute-binding protein [Planctomycetes bacterium]|nr:extracellular solute-binding protein [Planctomycetota bacterium]